MFAPNPYLTPWLGAASVLLAYAGLCVGVARTHARRQASAQNIAGGRASTHTPTGHAPAGTLQAVVHVVYASQTGHAESLARHSAQALQAAGRITQVLPLNQLTPATLQGLRSGCELLLVVSTQGEGDAPDNAQNFVRRCMQTSIDLSGLRYSVLALGDRGYQHFCGFGRRLDAWLQACGAEALWDRVEVHQEDSAAIAHWQSALGRLAPGAAEPAAADMPVPWPAQAEFAPWKLLRKQRLNPGSTGQAIYQLDWAPIESPLPDWQAGDLVQAMLPALDDGKPRDYSVANLAADGCLQLMVRRHVRPDGTVGTVSGWLCDTAEPGAILHLRLREHSGFRIGENAHRPLILIGNGTGLAGLRAHLQARAQALGNGTAPDQCTWLLLGERHAAHDALCDTTLRQWQHQGLISHLDRTYSRDATDTPYVQDALRVHGQRLRDWCRNGAAIYVCGSRQGMAVGVDQVLRDALGDAAVDELLQTGRLRRDVY